MHKLRLLALTAVALFALCAVSPAGTNFIVNGSFENSSFNCGGGYCLGLVGNAVPGWFIPASDGVYPWGLTNTNVYNAGPTPYGQQWFVLGRWDTGVDYTIQQTMTGLTPGDTYHLSFAIATELNCCAVAQVSFLSGSSTGPMNFTAPSSGAYWQNWATQNENFVATSSSVTIQFKDLAAEFPGGYDLGLDNVIVAPVPERGTLAMLLGFGMFNLAAVFSIRRKSKLT